MWILFLALSTARAADCEQPATTVSLGATLDRAEALYGDLDLDAFDQAMSEARSQVPCLDEVVPSPLVASLHRFEGLAAFLGGAEERARMAFGGARVLEPAYRFPRSVVPEGNPVLDDYEATNVAVNQTAPVPEPAEGSVRVDGRAANLRSTTFPGLFQRLDGGGAVVESAYLWPSMALPTYEVAGEAPSKKKLSMAKVGLFAGAGVAAIASGVLYGAAAAQSRRFDDPSTPYGELDEARRATNSLSVASGGVALVAVGAGVGGVLVGSF